MHENSHDWKLIARYFSKNASPEERRNVLHWASTDLRNREILDEAIRIWSNSGSNGSPPTVEAEQEWTDLLRRIELQYSRQESKANQRIWQALVLIATIILFGATLYYILEGGEPESWFHL